MGAESGPGMVHSSYPGAWGKWQHGVPVIRSPCPSSNPCLVGEREMRPESHSNAYTLQQQHLEHNE